MYYIHCSVRDRYSGSHPPLGRGPGLWVRGVQLGVPPVQLLLSGAGGVDGRGAVLRQRGREGEDLIGRDGGLAEDSKWVYVPPV